MDASRVIIPTVDLAKEYNMGKWKKHEAGKIGVELEEAVAMIQAAVCAVTETERGESSGGRWKNAGRRYCGRF